MGAGAARDCRRQRMTGAEGSATRRRPQARARRQRAHRRIPLPPPLLYAFPMIETALRCCPFCANENLVVVTFGSVAAKSTAVTCPECGALGPRASADDPPGHAQHMWNLRFGSDH
jgi:hypothetical protein